MNVPRSHRYRDPVFCDSGMTFQLDRSSCKGECYVLFLLHNFKRLSLALTSCSVIRALALEPKGVGFDSGQG